MPAASHRSGGFFLPLIVLEYSGERCDGSFGRARGRHCVHRTENSEWGRPRIFPDADQKGARTASVAGVSEILAKTDEADGHRMGLL